MPDRDPVAVSCLNCGELTANRSICDPCYVAAERGMRHFYGRQRGKATLCPRCGYSEVDNEVHGDHWICGDPPKEWRLATEKSDA